MFVFIHTIEVQTEQDLKAQETTARVLRVLSRNFCLGGKSILNKIFESRGGEKNFFRPSCGGPGACSPGNV